MRSHVHFCTKGALLYVHVRTNVLVATAVFRGAAGTQGEASTLGRDHGHAGVCARRHACHYDQRRKRGAVHLQHVQGHHNTMCATRAIGTLSIHRLFPRIPPMSVEQDCVHTLLESRNRLCLQTCVATYARTYVVTSCLFKVCPECVHMTHAFAKAQVNGMYMRTPDC